MSHTLDLLSTVEHGTVAGYVAGCRGSATSCGSSVTCTEVYIRYQGDWGFRKRVNAGESAVDIVAAELATLEAVRAADRSANRKAKAESAQAAADREERKRRQVEPRLVDKIVDEVRRLAGEGKTIREMAPLLGVSQMTVTRARQSLGIRFPRSKVDVAEVARLHAQGLTDTAIGRILGVSNSTISTIRRTKLNAPRIPVKAARVQEHSPRAARIARLLELHAEGKTDNEIAEALGITRTAAYQARTRAGLPLNRQRTRGPYTRRKERDVPAENLDRADQHPEVKATRVQEITVHGTPEGYTAGCRGRGCPEFPTCTEATLAAHRAARHEGEVR